MPCQPPPPLSLNLFQRLPGQLPPGQHDAPGLLGRDALVAALVAFLVMGRQADVARLYANLADKDGGQSSRSCR